MKILISSFNREDGVHIGRSERDPSKWYLMDSDGVLYDFDRERFCSPGDSFDLGNLNSSNWTTFTTARNVLKIVESVATEPHEPI